VLGSGGIALRRTIPEGLLPASNARLVSVCGTDPAKNRALARSLGVEAAPDLDALLCSGIDAVYIGTPPKGHLEQVARCARAGKHVLCEKPLGLSVGEVEQMIGLCRAAGVTLGTAFMMRFQSQHLAALQLVRSGRLGQPVFARAQLSCWHPPMEGAWRQDPTIAGGGSLIDMGGHCLDLLEMFFGPIAAVSCFTHRNVHRYASEDSAVATVRFAQGAIGVVDAFFCIPDEASPNALELYGSQGSLLARGTIGQEARGEMVAHLLDSGSAYDPRQARSVAAGVPIEPGVVNTYRAEIEEFSQALLEGREPTHSAALGLRSQKVLAACYESARLSRTVELEQESR
jgi:predicted dehydrogenase